MPTALPTLPLPATAVPTATSSPTASGIKKILVSAAHITYDSEHTSFVARGNVHIAIDGGSIIDCRYFAMDINANRFLAVGHVVAQWADGTRMPGAAIADFLDVGRAYYLPVLDGPDRWTYLNDDFRHPIKGREMPGDAFALPDPLKGHAFVRARRALIMPRTLIHFYAANLNTGEAIVPVPDYVLQLSNNPNFSQNSLSGASFDASYPFAGSPNASTAFHIRDAAGTGIFGAVEQRFVWSKSYLVGSVSPLNRSLKIYNALGLAHISPKVQLEGFAQEQAYQQHGFTRPGFANGLLNLKLTQALHGSYLEGSVNHFYQSLLADPQPAAGYTQNGTFFQFVPNHPVDAHLSWNGFDHSLSRLPLMYRLRSGYEVVHDSYGIVPVTALNGFPGETGLSGVDPAYANLAGIRTSTTLPYGNVYDYFLGGTLYLPSYRLARDRNGNTLNFNATFDMQRKQFSLPHHIDTQKTTFSLSKVYGPKASVFVAYTINETNDQYGVNQNFVYIPNPQIVAVAPGFAAFRGFQTLRDLSESFTYSPNPDFNLSLTAIESNNFPKPVPGFFGEAPTTVNADVRFHLHGRIYIDLSRSYYVNFGNQHYSPQFGFQIRG